jgi:hypothetical protein
MQVALSRLRASAGRNLTSRASLAPRASTNGPLGLEQGFTIPRTPSDHRVRPLTLALALFGYAGAALSARAQALTLSHARAPSLGYTGLLASDARGRVLRSCLELRASQLLLSVDTRGARYPLRIDLRIRLRGKLVDPGGFGAHLASASDGNAALIGALGNTSGAGADLVCTRSGEARIGRAPSSRATPAAGLKRSRLGEGEPC